MSIGELAKRSQLSPRGVGREGDKSESGRAETGTATWSETEVENVLGLLGLSPDTPLSCLVVETLPGSVPVSEPVSSGLGYERFLRTSPLTAIPPQC